MKAEKYLDPVFLTSHFVPSRLLPLLSILGTSLGLYLVFAVVPNERVMGAVQRVFYFHVGGALAAYAVIAILLFSSAFYLLTRKECWDALGEGAANVGLLFCSIVLASGMIWGKSAWNTWWRWEPRLVSFLILWLMLFSYVLLRSFSQDNPRQKSFAAVLGILAAINVPIVIVSVKFLNQAEQLHPEVVGRQGLREPSFVYTLVICSISMFFTAFWFTTVSTTNILLKRILLRCKRDIELHEV